jgi:AcrR family transcriptional regulator
MPKVSPEYRAGRREHILQAARQCFLRNGFHATSMQEIFTEAGMSAGAVYRYFAGKDDMVMAIAEDSLHDVIATISREGDPSHGGSIGDALAAGIESVKRRDEQDNLASLAIQVWAEAIRNPALAEKFVRLMTRTKAQLTSLAKRHQGGDLPADVPAEALASVLAAILPGYILQRALLGGDSVRGMPEALRALWPG